MSEKGRIKPLHAFAILIVVFIAALAIRLYPVIKNPEGFGPYGDTYLYHVIAYNLYKGNGFSGTDDGRVFSSGSGGVNPEYKPMITRGPVYPVFVSIIYRILSNGKEAESEQIWSRRWDGVRMAQCVLDAIVCVLVYFMARAISKTSLFPALISSVLYCFSFYNIYYTRALLSECVTTFLLTASILFCVLGLKHNKSYLWALAGALFGLVILSRPEYLLFPPVLMLYMVFINRRHILNGIKNFFVFLLAAIIVMSPWTARNYYIFKKPIPVAIGALGCNLFTGSFQGITTWPGWGKLPDGVFDSKEEKAYAESLMKSLGSRFSEGSIKAKEFDDALMRLALERIKKNPLKCLKSWVMNIPRLWYQFYRHMYLYREASGGFFIFYFIFAVFGLWKSANEERILMAPVCLLFCYLTFIFLPLHIEPRYGVALMPGIICLASIGIWKIMSRNDIP